MISFLTSRFGMYAIGSVLAAGAVGGFIWYWTSLTGQVEALQAENGRLRGDVERVLAANADLAERMRERDRLDAISDDVAADNRADEVAVETVFIEVERARNETVAEGGDAPAAPVLVNSADGVRRIIAVTGNSGAGADSDAENRP